MIFESHPSLRRFDDVYREYVGEIGLKLDGTIASHDIVGEITVFNDTTGEHMRISEIDFGQLIGCGCLVGVIIHVKEPVETEESKDDKNVT